MYGLMCSLVPATFDVLLLTLILIVNALNLAFKGPECCGQFAYLLNNLIIQVQAAKKGD